MTEAPPALASPPRRPRRRRAAALLLLALTAPAAAEEPRAWFVEIAAESGIDFVHQNGGTKPIVIYEQIPPGAALLDYDGDGDLDLFAVQGGPHRFPHPAGAPAAMHGLYRNDGVSNGVPRFVNVTVRAGVAWNGYGIGTTAADIDNDGDVDLFLTQFGPNLLYLNRGDGTFEDVTERTGVAGNAMSSSAGFSDVDGNGFVDLYVANYVNYAAGPEFCYYNGVKSGCSDVAYPGVPNELYLNLGPDADGLPRLREASEERGVRDPEGRGLGLAFGDLNGDLLLDLYLANDGGGNRLFLGDGKGKFRDYTLMSGAGYSEEGTGEAGMGIDVGDFDGDGHMDVIVTNFARETNALYRNEGAGLFDYASVETQIAKPSFLPLGWGTRFFDADLDGDMDLFVANGHVYDVCHEINPQDQFAQQNHLFLNDGSGGFQEISAEAGPGLQIAAVSRGAAFGDVDGDGDLDVYVANNGGPGHLLENRTPRGSRHWLRFALIGSTSNRESLGARVYVEGAGGRRMLQEVRSCGSYLSRSDPRPMFGLGEATEASVRVEWPAGMQRRYRGLHTDRTYLLKEAS